MIRAMMKAAAKVMKEMPWWQKALIGSAAAVAFSAAAKVLEYFIFVSGKTWRFAPLLNQEAT